MNIIIIYLKCTLWLFDILMHCENIPTIVLTYPSPHIFAFFIFILFTFLLTVFLLLLYRGEFLELLNAILLMSPNLFRLISTTYVFYCLTLPKSLFSCSVPKLVNRQREKWLQNFYSPLFYSPFQDLGPSSPGFLSSSLMHSYFFFLFSFIWLF